MANLSLIQIITHRVAETYHQLKLVTSKLHKTSSSIGFIKKALHYDVVPTFAISKIQK